MRTKVKVSRRAVEARVKRALAKEDELLKKCREDSRWYSDLGRYYIIDIRFSAIVRKNEDLEDLARELRVLREYEELSD